MPASVDVLLRSAIYYAGTFPPATLELADAMAGYARAANGPHAAILGRFVLSASRLDDFARLGPRFADADQARWPLSIVVGGAGSDLDQVKRFETSWPGCGEVRALEVGPQPAGGIAAIVARARPDVETFFELPIDANLEAGLEAIARHGVMAKVRTGGTVAGAIPAATDVVRFMRACSAAGVAFKATAGLHHALCGSHPLTYDADSVRAPMFGFLNMSIAAALIHSGAAFGDATEALGESSPGAFTFTAAGLEWRGRTISMTQLAETRRDFFRSFGSCAFDEPIRELEQLGLI